MRLRRRRDIWDVAVVGGGIAGLTGAWHAVRARSVLVASGARLRTLGVPGERELVIAY